MYEYIKGELTYAGVSYVVVENNGIGYKINVSSSAITKLGAIGKEVKLYTYLNVKEDLMELYGFLSRDELELYRILITVSGVGPKAGISILSTLTPDQFKVAVAKGDSKAIAKSPGVGAKTAGRIILELKDKISLDLSDTDGVEIESADFADNDPRSEAAEVLTVLGYTIQEARKAVSNLNGTVDEMVAQALKNMRGN
ncbi:MAG: Holliday junction branch migration protein RuvA [Clostridia bacterium]|nr:Holliday junction branch migration protein RuvA [Clostridia bacterium]